MALAAPPGGENPSAAYIAGQQHGAALATQHAAKPAPAPAPKQKPAASPARKPGKPASPPAQTLLQQAQAIAQAQTNAQIAAIKQQQDLYNQQALAKAGQINSATKAAAQLLQNWNLGGQTADSYNQAAQTIGGLAGGFSGQTGVDATNAAAQVQANLANLGAPAGGAKTSTGQVSDPAALQNVLYGLGGFIPGNLLETTGQAQAAVARGLPGSLLSYGQQQAAGAVSAGQAQADTLTPQILDAQGKLPQLVQQALSGLSDAQQRAFMNKLAVVKLRDAEQNQSFNQSYKVGQQKISVARLNLEAQRAANAQYNSDRSYQIALARLGIAQQGLALRATQNAFKAAHGGYTAAAIKKFNLQANAIANAGYHGTTSNRTAPNGSVVTSTTGAGQPYFQVLGQMMKKGIPVQNALAALDRVYPANLRPTPEALQKQLGPLTPGAIQQQVQVNKGTPGAASLAITNPSFLLAGGKVGKIVIAPGADRPGVATSSAVKGFVAHLAGVLNETLTIGTGSNHNRMTTDGNVSDHWDGHAADVLLSGPQLTRAGQAALILAGMPVAQALKQTGGLFNLTVDGHRVQIIFNSMIGGNHFTHLHVGIQ